MGEYVLGIDLGTSTTTASLVVDDIAQPIPIINEPTPVMPSVVSFFDKGKKVVIGTEAKKLKSHYPAATVYSAKRLIGRKFSNPEVKKHTRNFAFPIKEGPNDSVEIEIDGTLYTPQMIAAYLLGKVRKAACDITEQDIRKAVITVPANFNEAQRRATQQAGKMAGLEVLRIINEPTAAALAYGFGNSLEQKIAVYDFGGGTFDITILEVRDNFFEVRATHGESFLGGDDIDNQMVLFFLADIETNYGQKLTLGNDVYTRFLAEAERLKIELSIVDSVDLLITDLLKDAKGKPVDYEVTITRDVFEQIIAPVIDQSFICCEKALENAHLTPADIDAVVLVGGTTKIPYIQKRVAGFFGKEPFLGIETELVISMGAALLGQALLDNKAEDAAAPVLLDVVPLSLGVGSVGDYIEILVEKNEPLPIERTNIFTTAADNQDTVKIQVFQGDGKRKSESHLMGELELSDLRPARRGEVKVEVGFDIDTNGVLHVHAVDLETGKAQKISFNILGIGMERQKNE